LEDLRNKSKKKKVTLKKTAEFFNPKKDNTSKNPKHIIPKIKIPGKNEKSMNKTNSKEKRLKGILKNVKNLE